MVGRGCRSVALITTLALAAFGFVVVVGARPARALNVIVVSTTNDGGAGSLRAAFDTANTDGDDSEIVLQVGATYTLDTCPGTDEDLNANGDLDHTPDGQTLTITGRGATIVQTCAGERVIDDLGDAELIIRNVTITGGTTTGDGGGVQTDAPLTLDGVTVTGNTAGGEGGGVDASGGGAVTTITRTIISDNDALDGPGGGISSSGGGAETRITDSEISGNSSTEEGGGLNAGGGSATTIIIRSTVSGNNSATDGGGVAAGGGESVHQYVNSTITGNTAVRGGGVASSRDAEVDLLYTTVADNTAPTGANIAIYSFGEPEQTDWGRLVAFGSVVANPHSGPACRLPGPATQSDGYNYDTDGTCGFGAGAGDVSNGPDPLLVAVGDNGGPTPTRLPGAGSPLIDAIPAAACDASVTIDQRGIARPQDGDGNGVTGCDIGAVEVVYVPPAPPVALPPRFTG